MNKYFLLFLFLFPSLVFAGGGTTVRNGGGFGEMAAVMLFYKMERFLNPCLKSPTVCSLTGSEKQILEKVRESLTTEYQAYQLSFYSDADSKEDFITDANVGSPLTLRSDALADNAGLPHSISQIGELVLRGLLYHQNYFDQQLAPKVFGNVRLQTSTTAIDRNLLHWLKIEMADGTTSDELVFEQPEKSFDLTPAIYDNTLCNEKRNLTLRIKSLRLPLPGSENVILDVIWNCGGSKFGQAKFALNLKFTARGDLDITQIKARVFGIVAP